MHFVCVWLICKWPISHQLWQFVRTWATVLIIILLPCSLSSEHLSFDFSDNQPITTFRLCPETFWVSPVTYSRPSLTLQYHVLLFHSHSVLPGSRQAVAKCLPAQPPLQDRHCSWPVAPGPEQLSAGLWVRCPEAKGAKGTWLQHSAMFQCSVALMPALPLSAQTVCETSGTAQTLKQHGKWQWAQHTIQRISFMFKYWNSVKNDNQNNWY